MAFNFGAGVAEAGKAIADTAGKWTLEAQRAEEQRKGILLADELAGVREEKQRGFLDTQRVETQKFTAGENVENRKSAKELAQLQADTAIKTAGISAGATMGAAQLRSADADKDRTFQTGEREKDRQFQTGEKALDRRFQSGEKADDRAFQTEEKEKDRGFQGAERKEDRTFQGSEKEKDRQFQQPSVDADVLAKTIANQNAKLVQEARKEITEARASGDPERVRLAQQKEYDATYSSQQQVQQVSLYQAQAKVAESAMNFIQGKIATLQAGSMAMMPETQATIRQLNEQLRAREREFNSAMRTANEALQNLPAYNPPGAATSRAAPDLSKYLVPPTSLGLPRKKPGLIDTPPN